MNNFSYESTRIVLLGHSYCMYRLKKDFESLYKFASVVINSNILNAYRVEEIVLELYPGIIKLAETFKINQTVLLSLLMGENFNIPDDFKKYILPKSSKNNMRGFGILVDATTNKETVLKAFNYIKKELIPNDIAMFGTNYEKGHRNQKGNKDNQKIKGYLMIEKALIEGITIKEPGYLEGSREDFYIDKALNRLVDEELDYLDSTEANDSIYVDKQFKIKESIKRSYYDIIDRYRLPTYTKVEELRKILKNT